MNHSAARALMLTLLLGCGGSNRSTTPLAFAGDPGDAIAAVEAEITQRGFDAKCKARAYCLFEAESGVRVHIKVAKDRLALLVDVADAEALGAAREAEVRRKAEALGREIWAKASPRAEENARLARAEEKKKEVAEAEEAKRQRENAPRNTANADALNQMMESVQRGPGAGSSTDSGASGGVSVETRCCVNGQFLDCPVSQCTELGQCLFDCVSKGSSGCAQSCKSRHAPSCSRVPTRDAECAK